MIPYQKFQIYGTVILVADKPEPTTKEPFWVTSTVDRGATISFGKNGSYEGRDLEYSYDLETWTKFTWGSSTNSISTRAAGEKLYIRNNSHLGDPENNNDYIYLKLSGASDGQVKFGGVLGSLWNDLDTNTAYARCCNRLFKQIDYDCNYDELVFPTNLADSCYYDMFSDNKLSKAPHIKVTDTTISKDAFHFLFYKCTNLVDVSGIDISNCTTIEKSAFYGAFSGCTSLNTVLKLPMINLGQTCYAYMYNGCSSLKVFAEPGEGHMIPWSIPTTGVLANSEFYSHNNMFAGVITDSVNPTPRFTAGESYTYYVENEPV